ncbi:MAG: SsrA-binding protein SmpB [Patescibacteria group bacterium]|nr:SsrA-binding protein SmpB [Patescibacteria group bacterium]
MPTLAINKRARYDYNISDTYEAGLVLFGHEVKSIRSGQASLKGAFVTLKTRKNNKLPEIYLTNAHIPLYKRASNIKNYDPDRPRKLLIKSSEIKRLLGKKQAEGISFIPLNIHTKHNKLKLEFGIGKGKKKHDKREDLKKKDDKRKINRMMKTSN